MMLNICGYILAVVGVCCAASLQSDETGPCTKAGDCAAGKLYGDPKDCSKYYVCNHGSYISMACAAPLVFDTDSGACNYGAQSQCQMPCDAKEGERKPAQVSTDKTGPCYPSSYCIEGKLYGDPEDCTKYYQCVNAQLMKRPCAATLAFDTETGVCNYEALSYCQKPCEKDTREAELAPKSCEERFVMEVDASKGYASLCAHMTGGNGFSKDSCLTKACEVGGNAVNFRNGECYIKVCLARSSILVKSYGGWNVYRLPYIPDKEVDSKYSDCKKAFREVYRKEQGQSSDCEHLGGGDGHSIDTCLNLACMLKGNTANFKNGECYVKFCDGRSILPTEKHGGWDVYQTPLILH